MLRRRARGAAPARLRCRDDRRGGVVLGPLRASRSLSGGRRARRVDRAADRPRVTSTVPPGPSKPQIAAALDEARSRTLRILEPVPRAGQLRQVSELMSPLCWDLAHIGHYEELWLIRALT